VLQVVVFLALAFSIVIAVFAVQNTTAVAVSFLIFRAEAVAVSVLVLVSAALGAGAMLLLGVARDVRLRLRHRALIQQLRVAQARIEELQASAPVPETKALETGEVGSASGGQDAQRPPGPPAESPQRG
jgi:lipopolysaccharide assembly protein A